MEAQVIQKAKVYAKNQGRSLSEIIENYLKSLTAANKVQSPEISSSLNALMGSFKAPKGLDYKKILREGKGRRYE